MTRTSWRTGASNAGRACPRSTRAMWVSARASSTATTRARARGSRLARARLLPKRSSGTLSMLRTLADLGRALVLANVALAPEQPNGLQRTVQGGA
jgi:hypothetical protein